MSVMSIKKVYRAILHFVGVIPTVVFVVCTVLLLPIGIVTGHIFPCCYYPFLGPFSNIGEMRLTTLECLHETLIFVGPLLLWRFVFRGKNRAVRIFLELWFSLFWVFSGCVGYFLDYVYKH
jgi:hypothetical protein